MNSHTMSSESTVRTLRRFCPPALPSTRPTMTVAMIPDSWSRSAIRYGAVGRDDGDRHLDQVVVGEAHQSLGDEPGTEPDRCALATIVTTNETTPSSSVTGSVTARMAMANSTTPVPSLSRLSASTTVESRAGALQPLEQRHHGDGVGRGQDRAEDERDAEVEAGQRGHDHRDDGRRDDHARRREERDHRERPAQLADVDLVGRLEHEPGQQDREDQVGRDVDLCPGHDDRERQARRRRARRSSGSRAGGRRARSRSPARRAG